MICHYCGYNEPFTKKCKSCGSQFIYSSGTGTQRIEDELAQLFPTARILRMDADTTLSKNSYEINFDKFKKGEYDIMVGTQMIAKGLNFPKVSLIGILNADSSLSLPDFRAGERTFDLLHQVAGRAGRYRDDGKVIIQTTQPMAPAIQMAANNDLEHFYERELAQRKETMFPPFSRLINLSIRGKNEEKVKEATIALGDMASSLSDNDEEIEVFSPSPCLVDKMAGQWRWHVLLRSQSISKLLAFTRNLLSSYLLPSSLHLEIDVDPLSLF